MKNAPKKTGYFTSALISAILAYSSPAKAQDNYPSINDINEKYAALTGLSIEEVIGKTSVEVGIWVDPLERDKMIGILKTEGSLKDYFLKIKNKTEVLSVLVSMDFIELGGVKRIITTAIDITEQKKN